MADLGLPCSPWACYEAWQNNSDRWWQMSLRARLGVEAHANETNETLCVSFSRSRQTACMRAQLRMQTHKHTHTYACSNASTNTGTHARICIHKHGRGSRTPFKRWHLNPPHFSGGFKIHWHTRFSLKQTTFSSLDNLNFIFFLFSAPFLLRTS